jgi:hypothetical protein
MIEVVLCIKSKHCALILGLVPNLRLLSSVPKERKSLSAALSKDVPTDV